MDTSHPSTDAEATNGTLNLNAAQSLLPSLLFPVSQEETQPQGAKVSVNKSLPSSWVVRLD